MSLEGDVGTNWKRFKSNYAIYATATGISEKTEEVQAAIFLHCAGERVVDILDTLGLSGNEKKNINIIVAKLDSYFLPKSNTSVESHKFNTRIQTPEESFDDFVTDLRKIAANCEFGNLRDRLIKDRIVSGVQNKRVMERLLREPDITLDRAIEVCKAAEEAELNIKALVDQTKSLEVQEIQSQTSKKRQTLNQEARQGRRGDREERNNSTISEYEKNNKGSTKSGSSESKPDYRRRSQETKFQYYSRCGQMHKFRCPAYQKFCFVCNKIGHFAKMCKTRNVNVLDRVSDSSSDEQLVLETIEVADIVFDRKWLEMVTIVDCNMNVKFKLDTGAHINVIPENIFLRNLI